MNDQHPELRPGEVFLTNCAGEKIFQDIGWKSKRQGKVAYGADGQPIEGYFPVFVQKDELEENRDTSRPS